MYVYWAMIYCLLFVFFEIPIFTPPGGTLVFFRHTKISKFPQFGSNFHEIWHKSVSIGSHEVCQKDFPNSNFYLSPRPLGAGREVLCVFLVCQFFKTSNICRKMMIIYHILIQIDLIWQLRVLYYTPYRQFPPKGGGGC